MIWKCYKNLTKKSKEIKMMTKTTLIQKIVLDSLKWEQR